MESLDGTPASHLDDDVCVWLNEQLKSDIANAMANETIEKLATIYTDDAGAFLRVKEVLKAHRCLSDVSKAVRRRAHARAENVVNISGDEPPADVRVGSVLDDAPVHPLAVVPQGWVIRRATDDGKAALLRLRKRKLDGVDVHVEVPVARDPIVITTWMSNLSAGRKLLEVAWFGGGKWRRRVVERECLRDANKIVTALAPYGADVSTENRKDMVAYFAAYEGRNKPYITVKDVTEQMGWQPDGGFVLGNKAIGTATEFHGADAGDKIIARSIHSRGTFDGWRNAVSIAAEFPKVELGLYASLAAPLLELLQAPSFAVDWSGCSSQGKTTALCIAASAWAKPTDRGGGMITSWDASATAPERLAAILNGLPLLVDETKRAKSTGRVSPVPQSVYTITNGQGRARGSKAGLQEMRYWRTILLTTGEMSIVDMSQDGGTAARVLTLWGSPFDGLDQRVPEILISLGQHYGHAGPMFVQWLVANRATKLEEWSNRYAQLCLIYTRRLTAGGAVASNRIASYLATLELCAEMVHPLLGLPWDYVSPMSKLADQVAVGSRSVDRDEEAMQMVCSWATANRERFWSTHKSEQRPPAQGWLGRWDVDENSLTQDCDAIYVFPFALQSVLETAGYDAKAIVRTWADKGRLKLQDHGTRCVARFGPTGTAARFVGIKFVTQQH